jgi:hypothetical protein
MPQKLMDRVFLSVLIAAAVLVGPSLAFLALRLGDAYRVYVNLYTALAAIFATYQCFRVVQRLEGSPSSVVKPWVLTTFGLAAWAVAEIIWLCFIILTGEAPELSVCDILWLSGYLPLAAGLLSLSRPFLDSAKRLGYIKGRLMLLAVLATVYVPLLLLVLWKAATLRSEEMPVFALDATYVVLDTLVVVVSLTAAMVFSGGVAGLSLRLVAGGFFLFSVSDLLYTLAGVYEFAPADIMYALSYAVIAAGLQVYLEHVLPRTG